MFLNKHSLDILKGDGCFLVFSVTMWGFVCFEDDTWVLSLLWGDKQNQGTIVLCAHKLSSRQPFLSPYIPAKLPSRPPSTGGWLVKTELSLKLRRDIKLAWVPTHQAQRCLFRCPSEYTVPAGYLLTWWLSSTSYLTRFFPEEMSCISLLLWAVWDHSCKATVSHKPSKNGNSG